MEETNEKIKIKLNVKEELEKINSKTIYEYKKTLDVFEIPKVKIYEAKDNEKTVDFLFYDGDFFAVDRVNYEEEYEYDPEVEYTGISENLNYKIRKIPNVAKTRKILGIEDIETRIYDVSEYIVLLQKEDIKMIKVDNENNLTDMEISEHTIDEEKLQNQIEEYQIAEEEEERQERSFRNKIRRLKDKVKYVVIEPFRILKNKLRKANEIKMLTDGKHSIFDKED